MNPHRGVSARIVRGRPKAAPGWAGHRRPGLTPSPARPGKSRCGARAASGAYVVQLNDKRPGRTGHNRNGCVSTPHRELQGVVRLGAVPRSTRSRVPPRARRPENTLGRAHATAHFPGPGSPTKQTQGQNGTRATGPGGAAALYLPSSATADANRWSRQGRSAGDISTFYGQNNVVITTILLRYHL